MIKPVECYVPICDVCGKHVDEGGDYQCHYETEAAALDSALEDDGYGGSGAKMIDDKLCCTNCWMFDDDGEYAIR